ncbi:MAG: DUF1801 domain-containing protein [Sphaerochaetaceae bacterium]|nr:DUF1801 domain-containing protein [Sphaerochaetaceae bacterium]MDC7248129.1 DUF1801 domain-containing protein [Sphaerochaetaceae bacterium]
MKNEIFHETDPVFAYIDSFDSPAKELLVQLRSIIIEALPCQYEQTIRYGLPTFYHKKNICHFGGAKNHVALYPTPNPIVNLRDELKGFVCTKGSVHFPLDRPLPVHLIRKIINCRIEEMKEDGTL